jgi:hypothetical protein
VQAAGATIAAAAGFKVINTVSYAWSANNSVGGATDTTLGRFAAGVVEIGSGATVGSNGSLKLSQIIGGSTTPTTTVGPGAGTTPTIALAAGSSNLGGQISITVGTGPAGANAAIVTVNLAASAFVNPAFVQLTPANAAAAALSGSAGTQPYVTSTATAFTLTSGATALTAAAVYVFNYSVTGT